MKGQVLMPRRSAGATVPVIRNPLSCFAVGTLVKLRVGNQVRSMRIIQQGVPSPLYTDSADGTWLMVDDLKRGGMWGDKMFGNEYYSSSARRYLEGRMEELEPKIQECVREVLLPYRPGSGSGLEVNSGAYGLRSRIFLLSGPEVGISSKEDPFMPDEGSCLSYFLPGNSPEANARRVGLEYGKPVDCWLRTPYANGGKNNIACVRADGSVTGQPYWDFLEFRTTMVFWKDTIVDENMNILGRTGG